MQKTIQEGKAKIYVPEGKITKKLSVFYNPDMELNRSISVALLNSVKNKNMQIGLPLAASGIRGIRFLNELKKNKVKKVYFNDHNPKFFEILEKNFAMNKLSKGKITVSNMDANVFLENSMGFDYIDIDPFGSPNVFLENSIKRLSRDGILAVTATDTGCLSGSFQNACKRKYFAKPLKNELMHETGLRILIRKIQLIGMQHEKSLVPVFSYSLLHYMRVFFVCKKGKKKCDELLKKHKYLVYCNKCMNFFLSDYNCGECCDKKMLYGGPLWIGELFDKKLCDKMLKNCKEKEINGFLETICGEAKIDKPFFYDLHRIGKIHKVDIPRINGLIKKLRKNKYKAERTHFSKYGIKTNIEFNKFLKLIKE